MRREFAINLILLLGVNALIKPLYLLGIDVGVQNALGTDAYGQYAYWFSFAFMFGVLYDLGLQNYNAVTLSKNPALLSERLPVMLSLKLVLSALFGIVVLLAALAFGVQKGEIVLVGLAAAYHTMLSFLQLLRTNLGAQEKYAYNSLVSVADKAFLLVVLGAVLLYPPWRALLSVELFFVAQLVSLVFASVLTVWGTQLDAEQRWFRWDVPQMKALVIATLPYGLILLLATAFSRVDMVMLKLLSPEQYYEVGKYAGAYRLLDGINMIGFMFATLLLPMLSKQVSAGLPAGKLLRQASGYMAALGIGFAAWTSFHGSDLMQVLYKEATPDWGETLGWLMWAAVGIGLAYVFGSYLLSCGKLAFINKAFAVAVLINVVLNAVLIPRYGAKGAAIATVLTQLGVALVEYLACKQLVGAEGISRRWWPLPIYTGLVLATAYWLGPAQLGVLSALALQAIVCMLVGLFTGLLADPRELLARLK